MYLYELGRVSLVSGAYPRELSLTAKDEFCFLPREPFLPLGSLPSRVGSHNWQNENLRRKVPGQKLCVSYHEALGHSGLWLRRLPGLGPATLVDFLRHTLLRPMTTIRARMLSIAVVSLELWSLLLQARTVLVFSFSYMCQLCLRNSFDEKPMSFDARLIFGN